MSRSLVEKMRIGSLMLVVGGMTVSAYACGQAQESKAAEAGVLLSAEGSPPAAIARAPLTPEERAFYQDAARLAWPVLDQTAE